MPQIKAKLRMVNDNRYGRILQITWGVSWWTMETLRGQQFEGPVDRFGWMAGPRRWIVVTVVICLWLSDPADPDIPGLLENVFRFSYWLTYTCYRGIFCDCTCLDLANLYITCSMLYVNIPLTTSTSDSWYSREDFESIVSVLASCCVPPDLQEAEVALLEK